MFPAIDEQLGPWSFVANVRRTPRRGVIARRAPDFFPIAQIQCRDKSVSQYVALDEDSVTVNDRRTGEAPFQIHTLRIGLVVVNDRAGP